jgi:hypothetical protein
MLLDHTHASLKPKQAWDLIAFSECNRLVFSFSFFITSCSATVVVVQLLTQPSVQSTVLGRLHTR